MCVYNIICVFFSEPWRLRSRVVRNERAGTPNDASVTELCLASYECILFRYLLRKKKVYIIIV